MKVRISLLILLVMGMSVIAPARNAKQAVAPPATVAFENVNVVPMDRERVIEKQTVIVRDGRIAEIGPADKVKVPAGATRVNGTGRYLIPGLAEMHGHIPPAQAGEKEINATLALFVANGVTTVRGMFGFPNHVALRDRVNRGEILGPRLYVAGPALHGKSAPNPDQGEKLVREQKAAGFDLIKIHEELSEETYKRIVATANELKMPFGGHIPNSVELMGALKAKQGTIDHLDGYMEMLDADDSPKKITELAKATREAGVWNVPTMALYANIFTTESAESMLKRDEIKYASQKTVKGWVAEREKQLTQIPAEAMKEMADRRKRVLKGLSDGGAGILLGTDAPQIWNVPGFSLHREMQVMVEAGMTPYQILESGTRNVAVYLNTLKDSGTVEVGKYADLILLDANPLQRVANTSRRAGVMLRGRWLPEAEIRKILDDIAAMYKSA